MPGADPLVAGVGQVLDGDWEVARVLGTGATARAVLVARLRELDDGEVRVEHRVFKIALDEDKAASLHAEARALTQVGGGHVVRLLDGPRLLGERTVLDLQYAGGDDLTGGTLGALLRGEGRLSYHDLERFGGDLFAALDQLVAEGVRHRDLKPDNFAVFRRADRSRQLMLLDFSLSAASERDIGAGTRGYVDPFLGTARRPAFDDHAERYAAAVTLHEMASMSRPVWGDGATDPRATDEPTPDLAVEQFDPALREGLTAFFLRAFHRDADRRFETFRHMQEAWRGVFLAADAVAPATTPTTVGLDAQGLEQERDAAAAAAGLDTPLDAAGLSPRAISVAQSFGAATVGALLGVRRHEIAKARGAGSVIRKELNRRHRQWAPLLDRPVIEVVEGSPPTIDEMAQALLPAPRRASKRAEVWSACSSGWPTVLRRGRPRGTSPAAWGSRRPRCPGTARPPPRTGWRRSGSGWSATSWCGCSRARAASWSRPSWPPR